MIRFEKLSVPETIYPYVDAVVSADYSNGTFGSVADGKFTSGAGSMAIMQVEKGDDAKYESFMIKKGEHARIADFTKTPGQIVNITADELPSSYDVDNSLVAKADGTLKVGSGDVSFKVIEVTSYGVRATVVVSAPVQATV